VKRDAPHPVNQRFVAQENAGHNQADQIRRQDRLAFGGGRQTARKNSTRKINFTSGSLTRVAPSRVMINCVQIGINQSMTAVTTMKITSHQLKSAKSVAERQQPFQNR